MERDETVGPGAERCPTRWRGWLPIVAGVFVASGAHGVEGDSSRTLPDATFLQWSGGLVSRPLEDGSVLNEYVSRTGALEEPDVTLSVRFVPRFDCSPLIGVRVVGVAAADIGSTFDDGARMTFSIDDDPAELALLVDARENVTMLWIDAAAAGRERLRSRIDAGSRVELGFPGDRTIAFSLLGSRRSAAATESACRAHEPLPYGDE